MGCSQILGHLGGMLGGPGPLSHLNAPIKEANPAVSWADPIIVTPGALRSRTWEAQRSASALAGPTLPSQTKHTVIQGALGCQLAVHPIITDRIVYAKWCIVLP